METILIALIGSSALAAVIAGIFEAFRFRRERKAKKEDANKADMEEWQKRMEANNAIQNEALKFILYDRIRFLGQAYI